VLRNLARISCFYSGIQVRVFKSLRPTFRGEQPCDGRKGLLEPRLRPWQVPKARRG
jgi:hypothetical protein